MKEIRIQNDNIYPLIIDVSGSKAGIVGFKIKPEGWFSRLVWGRLRFSYVADWAEEGDGFSAVSKHE